MKLTEADIDNHRKVNPGFLLYQTQDNANITEWCSHCCGEVEILNIAEKQICPECSENIFPCSLCDCNSVSCNKCIIK